MSSDKEKEKFEKKLSSILSSATSAKAWSDLLPIVREIFQLLQKTKNNINFSKLNNKLLLAKRLAQCLNPECPSGVHEVVLDIYYIILHNIVFFNETCLMDNLGIYACGLFPFYPNATLSNKKKFMDKIIYGCFLCFRVDEITLCLPGLLTSLIQGLDDNNEETRKQIYNIFDDLKNKLTDNVFYGVYWTLILRNKLLRPSGIKFLFDKIMKYSDFKNLPKEKKEEIIFKEYPNINTVVVNALCQVIEEKDIPTIRIGMDFIITKLPLTKENIMITDEAKINLIISSLKLLIKNESSTTRRLKNLILGININEDYEDVNLESEDMIYKINLVVQAFLQIFNPDIQYPQEKLRNNIKIISQFFEIQEEFSSLILPKISFNILLCMVHYWQAELNSSEKAIQDEIIKKITDFMGKDEIYLEWLWISIANNLKSLIDNKIEDSENEDYLSIKDRKCVNIINEALQPLKFSILFFDLQSIEKKIKYYLPIITHLLNIMKKLIINNRGSLEKLRQILLNTLVIIKNLQGKINDNNALSIQTSLSASTSSISLNSSLSSINEGNKNNKDEGGRLSIYKEVEEEDIIIAQDDKFNINEDASLEKMLEINQNNILILNNFTESIINYQKFYINIINKYIEINKDSQITKDEMTIFRQSTEIIIRLQEYAQQSEVPEWILYLQKLIFNKDGNMKLSLEAANYLLDMNMSSFNHHDIYNKIKDNFQNKEIDLSIIDKEILEDMISKTGVQKNCQELLMGKLYLVLSDQSHQKSIIDLLIKIANIDPVKFLNIIKNTFNLKNFDSTQQSMKLYSDFWKLSNEYYNEMIFFKNGECIFNMLDCLDDDNPLLRHLSKSWLNQANQQFQKILDPIYNILLNDKISLQNNNNQIIVDKEYNTIEIRKCFRRLKNIILNTSVMEFLKETKVPQEILSCKNMDKLCTTDFTYLALLIGITLRFTQGKCQDSLSREFKIENYSVNASSCEFLEFLLNYIQDKNLLLKFAIEINEPIVSLLYKAIIDNDEVMQVQLLSVLKVVYFNPSPVFLKSQNNKNNALSLFKNKNLHKCLIKGMTSDYFYVRENFIKFTVQCLPHFSKVMNDAEGFVLFYNIGGNLITNLTKYIVGRIEIEKKGRKDTEIFSQFDTKNNNLVFKNYLDEYKENKRYDENEILTLLTGLRNILFQFMGSDENIEIKNKKNSENVEKAQWIEFKKTLVGNKKTSSLGISNFFNSMFGSENESNESKDGEISAMPKNLFNGQIYNLMSCLLLTWINQSDKYEDYDYCLNSNGILPVNENSKIGSLTKDDIKINMKNINKNPIKNVIKQIAINLFKGNPIDFINTLINIWCFSSNSEKNQNSKLILDKQYKLSIIELLISLKIPLNIILFCMGKVYQKQVISKNKDKRYLKSKELKCFATPYEFSLYEGKFFHFIYSYILLNPLLDIKGIIYFNNQTFTEKYESWKEMINLINIVNADTKIIYTSCWIYEVLQLLLYKFPLSQIYDNNEIKKGLLEIFNHVTNKLTEASFEGKTDSKYVKPRKIVLPFLPHVYYNIINEIYKANNLYKKVATGHQQKDSADNNEDLFDTGESKTPQIRKTSEDLDKKQKGTKGIVNDFYKVYFSAAKVYSEYLTEEIICDHPADVLNSIYIKLSLITLKSNFYKITLGIYYDNPNSIKKQLMEILKGVVGLIKAHQQDKNENVFYAEFSTDFLVSLMKDIPDLLTRIGKDIFINYLNGPTFFVSTPKMLRNWRKIISISVKHYPELLSDLIKTIGGGFLSLGSSDEDKIKTLRRISFIIYSCEKDTFAKEFEVIKSKVKDLLGSDNKNNKLKDEIFLMMRVLFLRFSHEGVMKMIRDLWPIIFMELIQNIEDQKRSQDINLVIESFKFIELLSLANVEEFCLYEWNFILDTYEMKNLDWRDEKSFLRILFEKEKKVFKPITAKYLYANEMFKNIDDELLKINNKGKSELYICPKKNNRKELYEGVKKFFYSIGSMNSYKVPVNYEQIKEIIENDFLEIEVKKSN